MVNKISIILNQDISLASKHSAAISIFFWMNFELKYVLILCLDQEGSLKRQ